MLPSSDHVQAQRSPPLDPDNWYLRPGQEMLCPCRRGQTDAYSISSERLIRLVLEEGKHPTQYV